MFYSVDKTEDLSLGCSLSLRGCSEEARGGARIYRTFCNEDQVVGTSKDYC